MAINIKDPDTDRLARELAALTGEPITVAVRAAIEERLVVLRRREQVPAGLDLGDIIVRGRQRRVLDERPDDEILGYGPDDQAWAVVAGWRRFGKGRHPAGLNFGDCFAYALAHLAGLPLLFQGEDFAQTDVAAVG